MAEARIIPQRLFTFYVIKIMLEYSDSKHFLLSSDIARRLKEYGANVERKAIYTDISILKQFGMDIPPEPDVGYYVNHRTFEFAELKHLVNAFMSSKFVTEKSSRNKSFKISNNNYFQ